jgi:hypothetical protein
MDSSQPVPGIYRHYKGALYEVFGVARHSETEEALVTYRALYGDYGLWVRPLAMFIETVEVRGENETEGENKSQPRFALEKAFC